MATIALMLLLVLSTVSSAQEPVAWRHGVVQPKGDAGFWWMAASAGFDRRQGLSLTMRGFDNDADLVKALLAGAIDSFEGSPSGAMIATSHAGDLKILGCPWPKLTHSFFARPQLKSLADLNGKRVGIAAPGALSDLVARALLGRIAIAPEDVTFVATGSDAARLRAIAAGTIDATVAASDFAARRDFGLKPLVYANDILPSFLRACVVTRGEVWRKRPDDLARLLAAMMNGYAHALAHRDETIALARRVAHLTRDDPTPGASFDDVATNHSISPTLDIDMPKFLWLRDFLAEDGRLDVDFEPGTMIDHSVREQALARIKAQ